MFYTNRLVIMLILICIILIIFALCFFYKKNKNNIETREKMSKSNKIVRFFMIILILLAIGTTVNYISNRTLYQLKSELQNKYDNVSNIDISGSQPDCYINIYVDEEECEFEDIEPIFISMMKEIQNKEIYEYIQKKQSKNPDFQLVFLHICFYTSEKRGAKSVFKFSSFKDFKEWELDGDSSKKYNVLDYMDN